ncbi:MAG TPA: hypothetical protein VFB69_00845 [Candidatus Dormibacteraeota bacterium]|nr:hypothetical protein [Candidatus Dormibacteraeota bacterium]
MIDIRSFLLKAGATALTVATTFVSAHYVTAHLKNPAAPLHPTVLTIAPSVRQSDVEPVTSTYAS